MRKTNYKYLTNIIFIIVFSYISYNLVDIINASFSIFNISSITNTKKINTIEVKSKALLSSRFNNLDNLKNVVTITYDKDYTKLDSIKCTKSEVTILYKNNKEKLNRTMASGISQNELLKLQKSNFLSKFYFAIKNPSLIRQRSELEKVYILARRKIEVFGPSDVSFYDLALASFNHINTPKLAFKNQRDSSEKGYINTFNHVTAQAIISSFYSEKLADIIGDLHERNNMLEITSGRFSKRQLNDSINNPEDNYIDIINNEIGQKIGLQLKIKYKLSENSQCTPLLLTAILNDIQSYYMWSLEIGLDNFRPTDDIVKHFSNKMNSILNK